jgi:septum formation protein
MGNSKLAFILASASPRRKELIDHLKIPYKILSLDVPEVSSASNPVIFSAEIAALKGEAVFKKLKDEGYDSLLVVSADTIVSLGEKIYGKPKSREEAAYFLRELSGKSHSVFTAVKVKFLFAGKEDSFSFVEESRVTFNKISQPLLERYLDSGDSLDKAGAYGIQGPSLTFISKVEGDYANVVGFPLSRFVEEAELFLKKKFPQEDVWLNLF